MRRESELRQLALNLSIDTLAELYVEFWESPKTPDRETILYELRDAGTILGGVQFAARVEERFTKVRDERRKAEAEANS